MAKIGQKTVGNIDGGPRMLANQRSPLDPRLGHPVPADRLRIRFLLPFPERLQPQRRIADSPGQDNGIPVFRPVAPHRLALGNQPQNGNGNRKRAVDRGCIPARAKDPEFLLVRQQRPRKSLQPLRLRPLRISDIKLVGKRLRPAGRKVGQTDPQRLARDILRRFILHEMRPGIQRVAAHYDLVSLGNLQNSRIILQLRAFLAPHGQCDKIIRDNLELMHPRAPLARGTGND